MKIENENGFIIYDDDEADDFEDLLVEFLRIYKIKELREGGLYNPNDQVRFFCDELDKLLGLQPLEVV